jgi:hypothetical protein
MTMVMMMRVPGTNEHDAPGYVAFCAPVNFTWSSDPHLASAKLRRGAP